MCLNLQVPGLAGSRRVAAEWTQTCAPRPRHRGRKWSHVTGAIRALPNTKEGGPGRPLAGQTRNCEVPALRLTGDGPESEGDNCLTEMSITGKKS